VYVGQTITYFNIWQFYVNRDWLHSRPVAQLANAPCAGFALVMQFLFLLDGSVSFLHRD
jgi:hypothetical protein